MYDYTWSEARKEWTGERVEEVWLEVCLNRVCRRGSRNFSRGGLRRKILKEKCLFIHVSTGVHIKTRQTCTSFSLLPFQDDCLQFFALFYYSLLFLKFERGVVPPCPPPPLWIRQWHG